MSYSVNLLTTKAECDSLLTIAAKDKSDLEFRQSSLVRQKDNYSDTSAAVDQNLLATNAEVAALQSVVASLPEGSAKDDNTTKLKRAELKQFLLNQKDKNYSGVALLTLELDLSRTQKELDETNAFVAVVQAQQALLN